MRKTLWFLTPVILASLLLLFWRSQSSHFYYAGTVEATEVDVSAQVSSTIAFIGVKEGSAVTQGQLLLALDGRDYKIDRDQITDDYRRALRLYRSQAIPEANFRRLKTQKDLADLRVQWCDIRSPITGRVLARYHEPGEWVAPGTRLFTLADLREVWCVFYVPQPKLAGLGYGQEVEAFLREVPNKIFKGVIIHINEEAEFTPKNVQTAEERTRLVYGIKAAFPNGNGLLKPGMTLESRLGQETRR